jgi:menaquinol-cytochrome c reductase cytochrome b/c subunit
MPETQSPPSAGANAAGSQEIDRGESAIREGKECPILGGQPLPPDWEKDHVPAFPRLLTQEFLALGVVVMVLLVVSYLFDAPLEELANPGKTPNPVKAPWYFVSLQELLHYAPPFIAGVCIPGLLIFVMCLLPYNSGKKILAPLMLLVAALIVPLFDEIIWEGMHRVAPGFADATRVYGLPSIFLLVVVAIVLTRFARSSRFDDEALVERLRKRLFLTFVFMLLILVLIGQFFRGQEWRWVWPWH